jgi:hypothetical protein
MEKEYIDFKQERDFGQVLNATFQFIGQDFKPLGQVILYYVAPFIVLASVITGVFVNNAFNWQDMIENPESFATFNDLFGQVGIVWLLNIISYLFLLLAVYSYISLYVEKGRGNFRKEDVWNKMTSNILPVIGTGIVVGIIVIAGFALCIIPGIYLGVSLSLVFIILIHEQGGFSHAFSRSFQLTKLQWWWTLLLVIVVTIITSILSGIVSFPMMINMFARTFHAVETGDFPNDFFGAFGTIYLVFANIITYLLYVIPFVALSIQYFNLVEISEKPSLAERIAAINRESDKNKDNDTEQ